MSILKDEERAVLHGAFERTKDLFKRRNTSEDWALNLVEGSKDLTTPLQWTHYYTFLANPNGYKEEEVCLKTAEEEYANNPNLIPPYEDCFEVTEYKNGNETIIYVKNKNLHPPKEEDEEDEEDEKTM